MNGERRCGVCTYIYMEYYSDIKRIKLVIFSNINGLRGY